MAFRVLRVLLVAGSFLPAVAWSQGAAGGTSVVVVATKAKGGPNIAPQVRNLIEKPLGKQIKVVPFPTYQKAAKRVGVKGPAVIAPESAVTIGTEAGVSHVLFVEGQMENQKVGKQTKRIAYVGVKLIAVATGDVIFTNRYVLKAKKLDAKTATSLLTEVSGALTKPATPPALVPDAGAPPPPAAPSTSPEGGTAEEAPPPPPTTPLAEGTLAAPATSTEPAPASVEPDPVPPALSPPPSAESTSSTVANTAVRHGRWRPALHVGLGGIGMQRQATTTSNGAKPPGYDGPLAGGFIQLAFYPLAIKGTGALHEGIGLTAEGYFMRVKTTMEESAASTLTVKSDVVGAGGGLAYRFVFWDSETAPDFTLKVGYGVFRFPLKSVAFPGTRYGNLIAGGAFTIPFVPQFGLIVGGAYEQRLPFGLKASGKLGKVSSQMGFRADFGIRLFFDPIEVMALGRFEQLRSKYTGTASRSNSRAQYTDVSMTDRYFGGFGTVGVAF